MLSVVAIVCVVVAIGTVVGAWLQARPKPTDRDAIVLAQRALRDAGVHETGSASATAGVYENTGAGERFDVWRVSLQIEGGAVIELDVDRATGGFVQLDDVVDGRYALTDAQAQAIHDFDGRFPSLDDRVRRNFTVAGAGLLAAGVAVCFTLFAPRRAAPLPADRPLLPA